MMYFKNEITGSPMVGIPLMVQRQIEMVSIQDTIWTATVRRRLRRRCFYRATDSGAQMVS